MLAAGVGALALAWWHGSVRSGAAEAAPDPPRVHAPAAPVAADVGPAPSQAAAATSAPLPPLDAPLALVADALRRRASTGDAFAACRLVAEFERCRRLQFQTQMHQVNRQRMEARIDQVTESQVEGFAQVLADMDEVLVRSREELAHCEGVEAPDGGGRVRYWRQAALAGHPAALRHYAVGNAFRLDDLMGVVEDLSVYRREAETLARRAATAGDASVTYALALAYFPRGEANLASAAAGFRPLLAQTIRPDPRESLVWFNALQRHPGVVDLPEAHPMRAAAAEAIAELARLLPPDEAAAAAAAGAAHARAWTPAVADTAQVAVHLNGGIADATREECAPPPR